MLQVKAFCHRWQDSDAHRRHPELESQLTTSQALWLEQVTQFSKPRFQVSEMMMVSTLMLL